MNIVYQRKLLSTLPYSRYSYCMPEYLTHESAWLEHAPFAFWLVREHQPSRIVELGTYVGYSYFTFCLAATYLPHKTDCFAVDTWEEDEMTDCNPAVIYECVRTYNEKKYQYFSKLIRSDFDGALQYFNDGTIDLLHLDGSHTYTGVKNDFINWLPKMSSRGIILFHATQLSGQGLGVFRLWEELRGHYPHFEFTHAFGLGVLAVGSDISGSLQTLLNQEEDSDYSGCTRYIYASLGKRISEKLYDSLDDSELRVLSDNL